MSEGRTQSPTTLRRQQARERGQVAHSPELTGAVGLLAAVALLGVWGDDLAAGLLALVREPLVGVPVLSADAAGVVERLRHLALGVAGPLGAVVAGVTTAAMLAHQAQVGGLWVPGLLAPDFARLWTLGQGANLAARGERGAWSLVKTLVVLLVAAWAVWSGWKGFQRLGGMEPSVLARAAGEALRQTTLTLAATTLALGLIDFALQYRRYEALLRVTPQEQREDLRAIEGDPTLRARRRQLAKTWRADSGAVLARASLVLLGRSDLTLVLSGGPPPRRVQVRTVTHGVTGARLRRAADSAGVARVDAPDLARRIARRRAPALPLSPEILNDLAALWPAAPGSAPGVRPSGSATP
jgi:flagellar biosynthesis protein FlhB